VHCISGRLPKIFSEAFLTQSSLTWLKDVRVTVEDFSLWSLTDGVDPPTGPEGGGVPTSGTAVLAFIPPAGGAAT
jgi:hypothetical protein